MLNNLIDSDMPATAITIANNMIPGYTPEFQMAKTWCGGHCIVNSLWLNDTQVTLVTSVYTSSCNGL